MITAILIDSDRKVVEEVSISPSHLAVEEEIMTRFWLATPVSKWDTLFHHERTVTGHESFVLFCEAYQGNGLICHRDRYGMLASARMSVEEVTQLIKWYELGPWPFPKGDNS